jgi:hypothetical protein
MNGWQQAGFLVLGGLISGMVGVGLTQLQQWERQREERRGRQRRALLEFNGPLLRLLVELSRQLEQGTDAARGNWYGGSRDIGAAKTWIFDSDKVANTLDWEPSRKLAQEVERAWSDHARLEVFDPAVRTQVEEVRRLARAVGFIGTDTRVTATELVQAVQELLASISAELERA